MEGKHGSIIVPIYRLEAIVLESLSMAGVLLKNTTCKVWDIDGFEGDVVEVGAFRERSRPYLEDFMMKHCKKNWTEIQSTKPSTLEFKGNW